MKTRPKRLAAAKGFLTFCLLASICLGFNGCGSPETTKPSHSSETEKKGESLTEEHDSPGSETSTESEANESETEEKGLPLPFTELNIPVPEGGILYGKLYDPWQLEVQQLEAKEASVPEGPTKAYPIVLLLHMLNGSSADWAKLPEALVKKGYAVVAMDLRGHRKSARIHGNSYRSWRLFTPVDWEELPKDVLRVMRFLEKNQEETPQVSAKQMAIIGASIGANTSILAANRDPGRVKTLVLLSPGLNYKGLEPALPLINLHLPVLIAASQEDLYSFESCEKLYKLVQGPKSFRAFQAAGHGTDMFQNEPSLSTEVLQWLGQYYPAEKYTVLMPKSTEEDTENP